MVMSDAKTGIHHRDTENTEGAQRKAVFLRASSMFSVSLW